MTQPAQSITRRTARWALALLALLLPMLAPAQQVTYFHTDALGSTVMESNEAGAVTYSRDFRPYGEHVIGATKEGPGFTGHVTDTVTGLSYMQQRYYDPSVGRFLGVDPLSADANTGGNFNRYWYANNNPYKFSDPDGRETTPNFACDLCKDAAAQGAAASSALARGDGKGAQMALQGSARQEGMSAASLAGKANAAGTTAVGLAAGGVAAAAGAVAGTNPKVSIGNNAVQFESVPRQLMPTAVTLGNVIIYGEGNNPGDRQDISQMSLGHEEMQHTFQAEQLGSLYLPVHLTLQAAATMVDGNTHGPTNVLEQGPHSREPRP